MSDNTEQEVQNQGAELPENLEQDKKPSIEDKAREMGWVSEDEWQGDPDEWASAEVFVARKPLFDKISKQSKQLKNYGAAIDQMKEYYVKLRKADHARYERELKEARRAARSEQDFDRVDEIDEELERHKKEAEQEIQEVSKDADNRAGEFQQEFLKWKDSNDWYEKDSTMRAKADALGVSYHQAGYSPEEVLEMVSDDIRKLFPNKFKNPNRDRPSSVASGRGGNRTRNDEDAIMSSMSPEDKKIMHNLINTGIVTKEQYLKDWKEMNGV